MILSRSESRRRLPALSLIRWLFLATLILLMLASFLVLYIRSVDADYRGGENRALALAKVQGGLTEIGEIVLYTWDEPIWIVRGRDHDNVEWILWERNDGIVKEKVSEGYSEPRIRERFAADRPAADPVRVLPGWFAGQPVWEIRYIRAPLSRQQSIDFYSFKDGTVLKTYVLPG
jgi:uncharacterized protein YpmB